MRHSKFRGRFDSFFQENLCLIEIKSLIGISPLKEVFVGLQGSSGQIRNQRLLDRKEPRQFPVLL